MHTTPLCSIMWYKHSRLQSWISQENTVETFRTKKTTSFSQHVYIHQPWLTFGGMGHMITVLHRRDYNIFSVFFLFFLVGWAWGGLWGPCMA